MNHDYTPKEIADATVQASYQHPELRGLDIPPVKAILDALPEPVDGTPPTRVSSQRVTGRFPYTGINFVRDGSPIRADLNNRTGTGRNVKKVRSSGPHLQWVKNTTGKVEDIITREEWDKANPPLRPDSSYGANYAHRRYGPKRKHAITVRKLSGWYGNFWKFSCTPCGLSINYPTWETAYHQATQHAQNNHRSQ